MDDDIINIDDYLDSKVGIKTGRPLSEKTKMAVRYDYRSFFAKFGIVTFGDYREARFRLVKYIEGKYSNLETRRAKLNLIYSFEAYYGIDTSDVIQSIVSAREEIGYSSQNYSCLPSRGELSKKVGVIEANTPKKCCAKILLLLSVCYDQVFRCDLATVKVRNYNVSIDNYLDIENHKIVFNYMSKNNNRNELILRDEHYGLFDKYMSCNDTDYLFMSNAKNRTVAYSIYIPRITERYFGVRLTQTDFRKIAARSEMETIGGLDFIEKYSKLSKSAIRNRNHGLDTSVKYYLDGLYKKIDDMSVKLDNLTITR